MNKTFKISAAGMRNIVFNNICDDNEFRFIIGNQEISMKRIFAEFISPRISQIHKIDPTVDSFNFNDLIKLHPDQISEIFPNSILNKFSEISHGNQISLNEEASNQLQKLSILLDNSEMYEGMDELFPSKTEQKKVEKFIEYFQIFSLEKSFLKIYNEKFYDDISSYFHLIDEKVLLKLPKMILYLIIRNKNLKVKSQDSLFDFIKLYFDKSNDQDECISRSSFYECIDISNLSEKKFHEFLEEIEINNLTSILWRKLKDFILKNVSINQKISNEKQNESKNNEILISYDNNTNNKFKGIITHLGNGSAKSAYDNSIIDITASTIHSSNYHPSKALEYEENNYYHSLDSGDRSKNGYEEWLCVDFKERKVKPSHYSIKSFAGSFCNLQNWVLEGSNDKIAWKTLDERNEEKSLDGIGLSNVFEIQKDNKNNDFYRYLRIRQTGVNSSNDYRFIISSLEYFGSIKEK